MGKEDQKSQDSNDPRPSAIHLYQDEGPKTSVSTTDGKRRLVIKAITVTALVIGLGSTFLHVTLFATEAWFSSRSAPATDRISSQPNAIASQSRSLDPPTPSHALETQSIPIGATTSAVNFSQTYPSLDVDQDGACQAAWSSLSSIPCHEHIFNRQWDDVAYDRFEGFGGPNPARYAPLVCQQSCKEALTAANELISQSCSADVVLKLDGYKGQFDTSYLESGPVQAIETLLTRNNHSCRTSSDSDFEYCMIEMVERWGILDTVHGGRPLDGLDTFLRKPYTAYGSTPGGWVFRSNGITEDHATLSDLESFKWYISPRRLGSGINSTDCGRCTLDWIQRKIRAFRPGDIMSPESHLPIQLPEYLNRYREAGQRCEALEWDRIWQEAISEYQQLGELSADWRSLPSGDWAYRVTHGYDVGDSPLKELNTVMIQVQEPTRTAAATIVLQCYKQLYHHLKSLPCNIHVTREEIEVMLLDGYRLLDWGYCKQECSKALDEAEDMLEACHDSTVQEYEIQLPKSSQLLATYNYYLKQHQHVCFPTRLFGGPCVHEFSQLNMTGWMYEGSPSSPIFTHQVSAMISELEKIPVPEAVLAAVGTPYGSPERERERNDYANWRFNLGINVCTNCVWQFTVGAGDVEQPKRYLEQADSIDAYLALAERLHTVCYERGYENYMGGILYGGDDLIWRTKNGIGQVHRYLQDEIDGLGPFGHHRRNAGLEGTTMTTLESYTSGTLWHLHAAARELQAEREHRLEEWRAEELTYRAREDMKVWKRSFWKDANGSYQGSWIWDPPIDTLDMNVPNSDRPSSPGADRQNPLEVVQHGMIKKVSPPPALVYNAFSSFWNARGPEIRAQNPGLTTKEIDSQIFRLWEALPSEQRQALEDQAEEAMRIYGKELSAWYAAHARPNEGPNNSISS